MLFSKHINRHNKKIALITENNENILYSDLNYYIQEFIKNLKERSIVFIICKNNLESLTGYFSMLKKNCVISLLDEKINEKLLYKLIDDYKPDYIFLPKNRKYKLKSFFSIYNFFNYNLMKSEKVKKKNYIKNFLY